MYTLLTQVTQLNHNDITTFGAFQVSKTMALDSSGVGVMPLDTSISDTNESVIALKTTSASNNKTCPLLDFIFTDNPSSFVGGVSATSADLFNIN
ncbi:hypothetical protein Plhal703r1_c19g0085481 [Plasmopara halstedii]